jgi:hypothetical protein
MRLSGVDPSVIRELSGIYKPFVKAFKELVSNAYDADATTITVSVARDFSTIEIRDDGIGLTPVEFRRDFARLGGSTAWQNQGLSPGGRQRIGYKGIGFLAVARYCNRMEVESRALRRHRDSLRLASTRRYSLEVAEAFRKLIPEELLRSRLRIHSVAAVARRRLQPLRSGYDYALQDGTIVLRSARARDQHGQFEVRYSIDCRDLILRASVDFDYLLSLERKADLQLLENFCQVRVSATRADMPAGTLVRLEGLKDFVVRDLAAPRRRGKSGNIGSQSGKEQFLWRLARAAPIVDSVPGERALPAPISKLLALQAKAGFPRLIVRWRGEATVELTREIAFPKGATAGDEGTIPFNVQDGGLRAVGYLVAQSEVIYPAELRGIAVRVCNVAIGEPSFFGLERTLAGVRKAALSQISGEIMVVDGLNSADAINSGRESFYEENTHFQVLRQALIGSEEALGGAVGQAIRLITDRSSIRSHVTSKILAARNRRKVLTDLSTAVTACARANPETGARITRFLASPVAADGLAAAPDVPMRPVGRLSGFIIDEVDGLGTEFAIDFAKRTVAFDFGRDIWSQSVYLDGRYYEVHFKQGRPADHICEFDNAHGRIYVNWAHPVKLYMDEYGFLRSAIVWRLAYHAAADDADVMISLALTLLSHRAE